VSGFRHDAVMLQETVEAIAPRAGGVYADATAGGGGHSEALLLASAPDGRVIAVDRDPDAVAAAAGRLASFGDRFTVRRGCYADLAETVRECGAERVDGLVADLGVSSHQLDDPDRGFAFGVSGPLDMRMDRTRGRTAADLTERLSERELADILYRYGEERRSRSIARSVKRACREGRMSSTEDLRRAVVRVLGPRRQGRRDPATRTFQALRIAVNDELDQLRVLVDSLPRLLNDGAVAVIISFHSLEDRIVKRAFRDTARLQPLTRRPLTPSRAELSVNARARSARFRAARRVGPDRGEEAGDPA
jgi:16S rRNA (cytosine1402-N4)-methyltransferase